MPLPQSQAKFEPPPFLSQSLWYCCCRRLITSLSLFCRCLITGQSCAAAVAVISSLPSLPIPVQSSDIATAAMLLLTLLLYSLTLHQPLINLAPYPHWHSLLSWLSSSRPHQTGRLASSPYPSSLTHYFPPSQGRLIHGRSAQEKSQL